MPEHVSKAVRENIFALPMHEPTVHPDSFYSRENPLGYPHLRYGYEISAEIFRPGEQYFPDGVVAFTDAKSAVNMRDERHTPYMGITATKLHELEHIALERRALPHNEAQINRDVAYRMGLSRFPFPSYS